MASGRPQLSDQGSNFYYSGTIGFAMQLRYMPIKNRVYTDVFAALLKHGRRILLAMLKLGVVYRTESQISIGRSIIESEEIRAVEPYYACSSINSFGIHCSSK